MKLSSAVFAFVLSATIGATAQDGPKILRVVPMGKVIPPPKSQPHSSLPPPVETPVTVAHAVLCLFPFSLKEASLAVEAKDDKWLESLNCIIANEGIPVVVIERNSLGWQVRLRPPGGEGSTLWGTRLDFKAPTGEPLDDSLRPIRQKAVR